MVKQFTTETATDYITKRVSKSLASGKKSFTINKSIFMRMFDSKVFTTVDFNTREGKRVSLNTEEMHSENFKFSMGIDLSQSTVIRYDIEKKRLYYINCFYNGYNFNF